MKREGVDRETGEIVETTFYTQWVRPIKDSSEIPDTKTMTEMSYVPADIQIKEMLDAGARLDAYRKARFSSDLTPEGEEEEIDPTTEPGVDLVDIGKTAQAVESRLSEQAQTANKKAAEAAKEAQDAAIQAEVDRKVKEALAAKEVKKP